MSYLLNLKVASLNSAQNAAGIFFYDVLEKKEKRLKRQENLSPYDITQNFFEILAL